MDHRVGKSSKRRLLGKPDNQKFVLALSPLHQKFAFCAEAFVGISASFTESTDKVKAMSMARRKCVVRGEPMENLPQDERLKA